MEEGAVDSEAGVLLRCESEGAPYCSACVSSSEMESRMLRSRHASRGLRVGRRLLLALEESARGGGWSTRSEAWRGWLAGEGRGTPDSHGGILGG